MPGMFPAAAGSTPPSTQTNTNEPKITSGDGTSSTTATPTTTTGGNPATGGASQADMANMVAQMVGVLLIQEDVVYFIIKLL